MSQFNTESVSENIKQPSKLVDGMLCIGVVLLLGIAVLLSGGGRAIAGQHAQQQANAAYEAGTAECPPCEEARRAKIKEEEAKAAKESTIDTSSDATSGATGESQPGTGTGADAD